MKNALPLLLLFLLFCAALECAAQDAKRNLPAVKAAVVEKAPPPAPVNASDASARQVLESLHELDRIQHELDSEEIRQNKSQVAWLQSQVTRDNLQARQRDAQQRFEKAKADAYKAAGIDPKQYDFNAETGVFTPIATTAAPAATPGAK